jgi:hypothetical protein
VREAIDNLTRDGIHLFLAGGKLRVIGHLDDVRRQFIKRHRDELLQVLPVDAERYMKGLAVGLRVDHQWLMDHFFTPEDLTLLSLGEYLRGNIEQYRNEIRRYLDLCNIKKEVTQ